MRGEREREEEEEIREKKMRKTADRRDYIKVVSQRLDGRAVVWTPVRTGTFFWPTMTQQFVPRKPRLVRPDSLTALKAYSGCHGNIIKFCIHIESIGYDRI